VGRDPAAIERTLSLGPVLIRDDPADAQAAIARFHEVNPGMTRAVLAGSADEITERCQAYVDAGFPHLIFHLPSPYDDETLERFASEVRPQLQR